MASRPHDKDDPRRVNVEALALRCGVLEGQSLLADFPRLRDALDDPDAEVAWRVEAARRERPGAEALLRLHVGVRTTVVRGCQRCLEPMEIALHVDRWLCLVRGEAEAALLDAEIEEDVLVLQPFVDLLSLIEDELLLELPVVPRHERCVDLAALGGADPKPTTDVDSPFGVLARLKGKAH